jgi:hypothetical protein
MARRSTASGVRSSWLASRVKACSRSTKARVRSSKASKARARAPISSSRRPSASRSGNCPGTPGATRAASCSSGALMRRASAWASSSDTAASARPPPSSQPSSSLRIGRTMSCRLTSTTSQGGAPACCSASRW